MVNIRKLMACSDYQNPDWKQTVLSDKQDFIPARTTDHRCVTIGGGISMTCFLARFLARRSSKLISGCFFASFVLCRVFPMIVLLKIVGP